MLLTSMFRFITFYLMIWSSLALDQREYSGDPARFLQLENSHRFTAEDSPCDCQKKRTLENVGLFHYV